MTVISDKPLFREDIKRLREFRTLPNLTKIPLFMGIMVFLTWVAWTTDSGLAKWTSYIGLGYMWMGMVTFMHDGTHNTLFKAKWANRAFGIICMIPVYFFSVFNSIRLIGEHYEMPWNQGQLVGSRTITSNPVQSFFWNNINWHIGHHVYPAIPWYNLIELHRLMKPTIEAKGAVVDKSYTAVFLKALLRGPEAEERLKVALEERRNAFNKPSPSPG